MSSSAAATADSLIFATRSPPWPLDNGTRIRSLRLAQGLARRFDLVLVTFTGGPTYDTSSATREDLERELPGAAIEMVPYDRRPPGGPRRNVLRRASNSFGHYETPSLRTVLTRLVAERPHAILHFEDPGVALAGIGAGARQTVLAPHNVEHRILLGVARGLPLSHRPFVELEARKVAREEQRLWRTADLCVAVSEVDREAMRAAGARRVELCPNGSDPRDPLPLPSVEPGAALRLLFIGSLRYWPYTLGMSWFVREALPAVEAAAGPVSVDAVGDPPDDRVPHEAVTYHGRVPDVVPFYERAHALVLPVFAGSGTRLKVIEAALFGRPLVSTALGVEGLPLREDEHYLRAEDAAGFAAATARLRHELEDGEPALARRCEAARGAVEHLTWPRITAELADLYAAEPQSTSVR